ncbi:MAG TPA: NIPSNAP family protein [Tepidisphaeraceae bacterium]|jgi:hypothetical protein
MNRRQFLATSAASVAALSLTPSGQGTSTLGATPQWIQIRTYHFASPAKLKAYSEFLAANVDSLVRAGAATVGLFRQFAADNPKLKQKDDNDLIVLLSHEGATTFLNFEVRLSVEKAYQEAGKELLLSSKDDPAFARMDVELLEAFYAFPKVKPGEISEGRVLEMRMYESPNQERAANKVEMFNKGEIPIFERVGMPGIFWGRAVAGQDLPHLTYMVHHKSIEDVPKNWKAFGSDPEWNKMKADPQYKDNVSRITNRFLRPVSGSQI